jgi:hypothetical protein
MNPDKPAASIFRMQRIAVKMETIAVKFLQN